MAQTFGGGFACISTTGFRAATGAASARTALPTDGAGQTPSYIRVSGTNACVKIGDSGVVATNGDTLIQPGDSLYLQVPKSATHIAYIQDSGAGMVNVQALNNS